VSLTELSLEHKRYKFCFLKAKCVWNFPWMRSWGNRQYTFHAFANSAVDRQGSDWCRSAAEGNTASRNYYPSNIAHVLVVSCPTVVFSLEGFTSFCLHVHFDACNIKATMNFKFSQQNRLEKWRLVLDKIWIIDHGVSIIFETLTS
jgi:hypothetical protein